MCVLMKQTELRSRLALKIKVISGCYKFPLCQHPRIISMDNLFKLSQRFSHLCKAEQLPLANAFSALPYLFLVKSHFMRTCIRVESGENKK